MAVSSSFGETIKGRIRVYKRKGQDDLGGKIRTDDGQGTRFQPALLTRGFSAHYALVRPYLVSWLRGVEDRVPLRGHIYEQKSINSTKF